MKEWITVMPGYVLNVTIYEVCWKECLCEWKTSTRAESLCAEECRAATALLCSIYSRRSVRWRLGYLETVVAWWWRCWRRST